VVNEKGDFMDNRLIGQESALLIPERLFRRRIGVSEATFYRWRLLGITPAAVTLRKRRFYTEKAISEWCLDRTVQPQNLSNTSDGDK
jgi:hypothetical protein